MIKLGNTNIANVRLGDTPIIRAYQGDALVWGEPPLYDAEIEYLENSVEGGGTAYIELDYIPKDQDNECYAVFELLGYPEGMNFAQWFGCYVTDNTDIYRISQYGKNLDSINAYFNSKYGKIQVFSNIQNNVRYNIYLGNGIATVNGVTQEIQTLKGDDNTAAIRIFVSNNTKGWTYGRMYSLKWIKDGNVVFDLIPVRKGDVGYMYDKVSKKLYGNKNNDGSKFILGPDVTSTLTTRKSAKRYSPEETPTIEELQEEPIIGENGNYNESY